MLLLIINAGSSSLKFQLIDSQTWQPVYRGHLDGLNLNKCTYLEQYQTKVTKSKRPCPNHTEALQIGLKAMLTSRVINNLKNITAIGHRVVHGGEKYFKATLITEPVIKDLKRLNILAPLHNPPNLEGISACQKLLPSIPNIAVFDTAWHHTLPAKAYLYGLPYNFYQKYRIRRYGFHGSSHQYVANQAINYLKSKNLPFAKIITCHLGNGCSLTAIKDGQSIDTSMGFTPLEGLIMGTRSGDIDAGLAYFLYKNKKIDPSKFNHLLNHRSGLLGLSGLSSDVRHLRDAWFIKKNAAAKRALDVFCYRIAKYIGSYSAVLNGLDSIVFTAGIGENAWYIRQWVCDYLLYLNIKLDAKKNQANAYDISHKKSSVKILIIPTNEELQIAKEINKFL